MPSLPLPTPRTFLVAEENSVQRTLLREVLQMLAPCRVDETADGPTALAQAQAHPPDLILLHYELPPDGALAVLARLRAAPHVVPVPVVVLAYSREPADRVRIEAFRGTHWLEKPYDLDELEQTILALLPAPAASNHPAKRNRPDLAEELRIAAQDAGRKSVLRRMGVLRTKEG